ncbi:hypothetical protein Hanom_Chr02g00102471 [Helianthus anomalus]
MTRYAFNQTGCQAGSRLWATFRMCRTTHVRFQVISGSGEPRPKWPALSLQVQRTLVPCCIIAQID